MWRPMDPKKVGPEIVDLKGPGVPTRAPERTRKEGGEVLRWSGWVGNSVGFFGLASHTYRSPVVTWWHTRGKLNS
jgi:hypothetical protein